MKTYEELEREVAALTAERDAANERFEKHTASIAEWTSTAAEIIGLGEHGKVTPDQILDQLIYGRQWASDMQTKLTAAEAELDAAKRYAALNISDLHDKLHASELNCQSLHAALDAAKRALAETENKVLHRDHQVASMITWLENYQPDVFKRGLWDALPKSPDAVKKPRFEKVYCSQCGGEFGPRDSGYSHCKDHIRDAALAAKSTEHTVSICSAHQTPVVGCPRCHVAVTAAKSPLG